GQDALEPDHDQIIDQVCADILGPAAHVIQLEATHALADGGFDLTLRFHRSPRARAMSPRGGYRLGALRSVIRPGSPVLGPSQNYRTRIIVQGNRKNFLALESWCAKTGGIHKIG